MTAEASNPPPDHVTMAVLWTQTDKLRTELLGAIGGVRGELHSYVERHDQAHGAAEQLDAARREAHTAKHDSERKERASLIRWAVTTVLVAAGTFAGIVIPIIRG